MVRFVCPLPLRPIDFLPTGEPPLGHSGRVRLGFLWYAGDFLAAGQIARAGHSNDVFCTPLSLYVLLETWPRLRAWHGFSDFLLLGTNCSVTGGRTRRVAAPRAVLPHPPPPPRPSTHHVTEQVPSLLPGGQPWMTRLDQNLRRGLSTGAWERAWGFCRHRLTDILRLRFTLTTRI